MRALHKLSHMVLTLAALVMMSVSSLAADPGTPGAAANDQAAGWVLIYNIYTSSAANPTAANTRISVTNVHESRFQAVHFFFVDGLSCAVADSFVCLTPNQTMTFFAADVDPGVTGFIYAIATNDDGTADPCGRLIGDERVKFESRHSGSLGAEVLTRATQAAVDQTSMTQDILVRAPRVLAVANIPSLTEGNDIKLVINRIGADLRTSNLGIGTLFGILYDELENPYSWTSAGGCQINRSLDNSNFPRTTPRLNTVIPAGSVGWMKFWSTSDGNAALGGFQDTGLIGAVFFLNPSASGFSGAENLHKLTIQDDNSIIRMPVFPSNCGFRGQACIITT